MNDGVNIQSQASAIMFAGAGAIAADPLGLYLGTEASDFLTTEAGSRLQKE